MYRNRVWVCKCTGKTNLTYEEALVSEKHASEKVQELPKELVAPALRIIQFSKNLCLLGVGWVNVFAIWLNETSIKLWLSYNSLLSIWVIYLCGIVRFWWVYHFKTFCILCLLFQSPKYTHSVYCYFGTCAKASLVRFVLPGEMF